MDSAGRWSKSPRLDPIGRQTTSTSPDRLDGFEKGRVPRSVRQRQLLEVAEGIFAREGYQGASLERVAQEAGVTRQYLTKLFGDKQGLYLACHTRARHQLEELLTEAASSLPAEPSEVDARQLLRAVAEAYFRFVRDHGAGWDVLFGGGAAVAGPVATRVQDLRAQTIQMLGGFIRLGAPDIDDQRVELIANSMSGAASQLALWWRRTDIDLDLLLDGFVDLFWQGVEPHARSG